MGSRPSSPPAASPPPLTRLMRGDRATRVHVYSSRGRRPGCCDFVQTVTNRAGAGDPALSYGVDINPWLSRCQALTVLISMTLVSFTSSTMACRRDSLRITR